MLKCYKTNVPKKHTQTIDTIEPDCWIDLNSPSIEEIDKVVEATSIDRNLILKMLDEDELPRVEASGNATLIVIDVPSFGGRHRHITYPLGIIITKNGFIITIAPKPLSVLNKFRNSNAPSFRTAKKTRFLIQILNATAAQYIKVLDEVYRDIEEKEKVLKKSTKNDDLIELLNTEKTLVYFLSSLKENDLVLERLSKGVVVPLYEGDLDMLEDAIIETHQAIDTAKLYRDILSSINSTYATVVSNNLNDVMKFLAGFTIILSVPTIISSFMGMNVPFGDASTSPSAAPILLVASILISLIIGHWLKKHDML